jgi:long-chain fatty acid transport protein
MNHGTRSTGRANAFVATADDGSAIFHNPAGITQVTGVNLYIGVNAIGPQSQFTPEDGGSEVETETGTAFAPYGYMTAEVTDMISVGLGVNPPYGLSIEWGEDSPGRDIIRKQQLRTWFITPVAAADLGKVGAHGLSVAVGVDLVPASAYLRRDILFGEEVGQVELGGSDFGVGGRVGVHYEPPAVEGLSAGLMYRLPVELGFDGEANFDIDDPALRSALPPDGYGSVSLTLPAVFAAGVAYRFTPELQAEVNANYTGWSSYDELPIELPDGSMQVSERNWEDKVAYRIGLEYSRDRWAARAGYAYDPTPVPDATLDFTLPDANRNILTAGFGIDMPAKTHVDLAAWYLLPTSRETADEMFAPREKGEFEVQAWVLCLGLNKGF